MGYFFVSLMVVLTVYSQVVIKWQVSTIAPWPESWLNKSPLLLSFTFSLWVLSALFAAFLAFLAWSIALTKLDLTQAYPLISLTFVFIMLSGWYFFNEPLSTLKIVGILLIIAGVILGSLGRVACRELMCLRI